MWTGLYKSRLPESSYLSDVPGQEGRHGDLQSILFLHASPLGWCTLGHGGNNRCLSLLVEFCGEQLDQAIDLAEHVLVSSHLCLLFLPFYQA